MTKKTTKTEETAAVSNGVAVIPASELSNDPIFITLRALNTEVSILHHKAGSYDKLAEQYAELKEKDEQREKADEARGEVIEIVCQSGKLEYTADSIPLQTMMETLAEVLAVLPANEVNTKLNNILVLL